jgi:hypothetical protein
MTAHFAPLVKADMDTRQPKSPSERAAQISPAAFSVPEFCSAHRISRALFYIMARDGRAPTIFKCGRRTLISVEAADAWRRRMEAASGTAQ